MDTSTWRSSSCRCGDSHIALDAQGVYGDTMPTSLRGTPIFPLGVATLLVHRRTSGIYPATHPPAHPRTEPRPRRPYTAHTRSRHAPRIATDYALRHCDGFACLIADFARIADSDYRYPRKALLRLDSSIFKNFAKLMFHEVSVRNCPICPTPALFCRQRRSPALEWSTRRRFRSACPNNRRNAPV